MNIIVPNKPQAMEPPRSTAYYYADLEKIKKTRVDQIEKDLQNELSEYVESNEVVNDGAVREVPPLRDRQWSLPEYHTPENGRKVEETYSTAGTFPMPEPKEKEPLLAELEVVGRLPLTQLDSASGVRRSRSWYLCCPNVGEEEISRESSWRYSSLRPVTAPPAPGQNGFHQMVASQSSGRDDAAALRTERDALARALAAERQRAATAARAHDARLAELHGVIAELVRRRAAHKQSAAIPEEELSAERQRAATAARAHDARLAELHGVIAELVRRRAAHKQSAAIPEEELSDECESTTQPAGELDNDGDQSRTEQIDSSSALSPSELPAPPPAAARTDDDGTLEAGGTAAEADATSADTNTPQHHHRCCGDATEESDNSAGSCDKERGSPSYTPPVIPASCGRQTKLAARVRLRRATDHHQTWCGSSPPTADFREALANTDSDDCIWRVRWLRSEASLLVSRGALSRCGESARRLHVACAQLEAATGAVMDALRAADRALEAYDVLLALAETAHTCDTQRADAEAVAWRLLRASVTNAPAQPALSPGPWLQRDDDSPESQTPPVAPWGARQEAQLREYAASLKAQTVALRQHAYNPTLFSHHDIDEEDIPAAAGVFSMADMEAAVMLEEMLTVRVSNMERQHGPEHTEHKSDRESSRSRRRRERQWRPHAETDL